MMFRTFSTSSTNGGRDLSQCPISRLHSSRQSRRGQMWARPLEQFHRQHHLFGGGSRDAVPPRLLQPPQSDSIDDLLPNGLERRSTRACPAHRACRSLQRTTGIEIQKASSAPPQESIRMVQGDIGQDQEAVIEIQRVQIDSLRRTLMGMATGVSGADDYLSAVSQHALGAGDDRERHFCSRRLVRSLIVSRSDLQNSKPPCRRNEDFCEKLQDAHDVMADRCPCWRSATPPS